VDKTLIEENIPLYVLFVAGNKKMNEEDWIALRTNRSLATIEASFTWRHRHSHDMYRTMFVVDLPSRKLVFHTDNVTEVPADIERFAR
jgi:hypothetical protein